ncbi:MAG: hypothetical protein JNK45_24670 [Myxococcales bacterium]|nr:hypothetical protein [Myxococcales bacterium]
MGADAADGTHPATLDPLAIASRLGALPDRTMRAARLAGWIIDAEPGDAAWLLDVLATAGRSGGPPFFVGLLAAVDMLGSDRLPYATRAAIHGAAVARGLEACRELLFVADAQGDVKAGAPRPLVPGTRPLTLGERKSLARSWRRDVLQRLLTDPHADVVALLLANPHITEDDVLRIATARRSSAEVLGLLHRSPRWSLSARVRVALVRNPRFPLPMALQLVGLLDAVEIRELAHDARLPPALRAAMQRRVQPGM